MMIDEPVGQPSPAPRVSVVTICMNRKHDIRSTCESIARQTWANYEWIVVDGASTDGTLEILREYEKHIAILISESDNGLYDAMNKGILAATGEYVVFMNGGDRFAFDGILEKVFSGQSYSADILYGAVYIEEGGEILEVREAPDEQEVNKFFFSYRFLNHQGMFIRRELFSHYGLYDLDFPISADWEKCIVFAAGGCKFTRIDEVVAIFLLDGKSTASDNRLAIAQEREQLLQKHFTESEIERAKAMEVSQWKYRKVWGTVLSLAKTRNGRKWKYQLFGLTLLKVKQHTLARKRWYLLGFIPVWG